MGFGECPECGKMTLIQRKWRDAWELVHEVRCVNPECDFRQEIGREDIEDNEEDDLERELREIDDIMNL